MREKEAIDPRWPLLAYLPPDAQIEGYVGVDTMGAEANGYLDFSCAVEEAPVCLQALIDQKLMQVAEDITQWEEYRQSTGDEMRRVAAAKIICELRELHATLPQGPLFDCRVRYRGVVLWVGPAKAERGHMCIEEIGLVGKNTALFDAASDLRDAARMLERLAQLPY